tara:strand:+ start:903 stop:1115 length:213 start_codon:yes stop_codon:yes gene_type:complete
MTFRESEDVIPVVKQAMTLARSWCADVAILSDLSIVKVSDFDSASSNLVILEVIKRPVYGWDGRSKSLLH